MRKIPLILLGILILGWLIAGQITYILSPVDAAIVVQLGKPMGEPKMAPGLYFKMPFIQQVLRFDKRLQDYDTNPKDVITLDKKTLRVDYYAKWRIVNPRNFYEALVDKFGAEARLDEMIYSELRVEFGRHDLHEIVSVQRQKIMDMVRDRVDEQLKGSGISIVDVRIKAADLPQENEEAVFNRMITERERVAKRYRSEGEQNSRRIRAEADRQRVEIIAGARKKAQEMMGDGDREATRIYAEAYTQDPEFYAYYRTLEAYSTSLTDEVTLYLSPASRFLRLLHGDTEIN